MAAKREVRSISLITGIITALAIVVSQFFYFEKPDSLEKKASTGQQQDQSSDNHTDAYITLPSSTLPSSTTHPEFQQQSFCLFEIIFPEKEVEQHDFSVSIPLGKFFETLFTTIISPNAP
jgi:hypothetical protein